MDNLTTNKSHIPCQSWVNQNGWSTTSTQRPLLNTPTDSQHLSLGSSSDQRHCYDPLQVSSQSCVSSVGTLTSGNNTHHSNMFKKSHLSNNPSSTTLFTNTVIPSTSNTMSFNQQSCHGSSMPLTANPGKIVPQPSFPQQQGLQPQHLPFLSTHSPYKASFQPPVTNQGLPNGFQNLPTSLPSCGRRVSRSQAPFEGANVESAGFAGYTCNASSSSQEQPQWTPSSHSRGKLPLLHWSVCYVLFVAYPGCVYLILCLNCTRPV